MQSRPDMLDMPVGVPENPEEEAEMNSIILVAVCLMAEAGNQGPVGRRLVADVIWNRNELRRLPASEIVRQPHQFESIWGKSDQDLADKAMFYAAHAPKIWKECLRTAGALVNRTYVPTTAHTHFYNPKLCNPTWASSLKDVQKYKDHVFGRM